MPVNEQITNYVTANLSQGYSIDSIRKQLISSGWPKQDVDDSIRVVNASQGQPPVTGSAHPVAHEKMGIVEKFKLVLKNPNLFFERVKADQGTGDAFKYYLVLAIFTIIVALPLFAATPFLNGFSMLDSGLMTFISIISIGNIVLIYLLAIFLIYIAVGFQHIFVMIFGGKGGYHQTFKAIVYGGTTPQMIGALPALALSLLASSGLSPVPAGYILIAETVITLVFGLWGLYLAAKGLSKLHDVSFLRGVLMIVIISIIIPVLLIGITIGATLFALGAVNPSTWTGERATGFHNIGAPAVGGWQLSENPTSNQFVLNLENNIPSRISITGVTITIGTEECTTTSGTGMYAKDEDIRITANCGPQSGSYIADVKIEYENLDTGLDGFRETGTLTGQVI